MAASEVDTTLKILVIGDSSVGKTCAILRFCEGVFHESYVSSIGIDSRDRVLQIDGKRVCLRIWDTAGQERYRTLTSAYYRGAMGIMVMYDITNEASFHHLPGWLENIDKMAPPDTSKIILGNKCDKSWSRQVDFKRAQELAENYSVEVLEASCKTNENIDEAFISLARKILETKERRASRFSDRPPVLYWNEKKDNGFSCKC